MNLYKREIYKKSLQHAERRNHKYLYKIGDRYIYPEDVAGKAKSTASNIGSMASAAGTAAKTKINKVIADQKQKHKDRKFVKNSNPGWSNEGANRQRIETEKRNEESWRKHIQSPEYKQGEYNRKASEIGDEEAYKRMVASNRPGRRKSSELERQKEKTANRKKGQELFSRYYQQLGAKSHGSVYDFRSNDLTNKEKELSARASAEYKKHPDWGLDEDSVMGSKKNHDAIEKRDDELIAKKEAIDKSKERNKQRLTGKKQLDKIHNRAKAKSSADRTHIDPDNSTSLARDSMSYRRSMLEQINSAHRGATKNIQLDNKFMILGNSGYFTSDSIERQKRKTRLRKLKQSRSN